MTTTVDPSDRALESAERLSAAADELTGADGEQPSFDSLGGGVIIATPGRLIDLGDRGELSVADIETLVLDEADRMADMGFMPQVEWVLRRLERKHQTLLFSATLDGAVDRLVSRYLTDPVHHEVASPSATVEEMEHRFLEVFQMDRVKVCATICRHSEKTLVFVRTKQIGRAHV